MQTRFLPLLCLPIAIGLSLPALAQHNSTSRPASTGTQEGTVPKGRQQPMERHTRTTWHYHSGPKRNAVPGDSTATKPAATPNQHATDAGK